MKHTGLLNQHMKFKRELKESMKKENEEICNNIDEYQEQAYKTAIYPKEYAVIYPMLAKMEELGELAGIFAKAIRDNNGDLTNKDMENIEKEHGDGFWNDAALATDLGYKLSSVFGKNLVKVLSRLKRGKIKGSGDNR